MTPRRTGSRTTPGPRSLIVAVAIGLVGSLAILSAGVNFLLPNGTATAQEKGERSDRSASTAPGAVSGGVDLDVKARNAGNLKLQIAARVRLNEGSDALGQANVVAFTDMKDMPGAHGSGPLPMTEVPNEPGVYATQTSVPMVGDYAVRVQVTQPVQAETTKVVEMGVRPGR